MDEPFYSAGLRFECTGCSHCCRHEPGYVFLTASDLSRLAETTGLSEADFVKSYCRSIDLHGISRLSLTETENFDCIFWRDGGCTVYAGRPVQCRTYPFWGSNLDSAAEWEALAASCPGANRGRLYSQTEIEKLVADRGREALLEGRTE